VLKEKIKRFCKEFNLCEQEEEKQKLSEELLKLKSLKVEYYREKKKPIAYVGSSRKV